jgi:voltage-gated potassium channel
MIFFQNIQALLAKLRREAVVRAISRSNMLYAALLVVLLVAVGAVGFAILEGWNLLDAVYATVITVATVGYGDFSPKTVAGRIFTIVFTLTAIGIAGYALSTVAAFVIEREHRRFHRMMEEQKMKQIADLEQHIILCGGGYVGKRSANEFYKTQTPFVVIEPREDILRWTLLYLHRDYVAKKLRQYQDLDYLENDTSAYEQMGVAELAESAGVLYLQEDPTKDVTLLRAGIARARGVVVAMDEDKDNLFVVLSARQLARRFDNTNLYIVARVVDEENSTKLRAAGADKVISTNIMGGFQLASHMLHPELGAFWEHLLYGDEQMIRFMDLVLDQYPDLVGRTVADIKRQRGQTVIAIRRNGQYEYTPEAETVLREHDVLIVLGQAAGAK